MTRKNYKSVESPLTPHPAVVYKYIIIIISLQ